MVDIVKNDKFSVPVRMTLVGGIQVYGVVFLERDQRILEMVCGEAKFFPFKSSSSLSLMNKENVLQIDILSVDDMKQLVNQFPRVDFQYIANNQW
ncbi:hypothetical protein [Cypionkella sp.]|uniref:hypothetical protein n=1 Tax=Cypionkella sp. TaxID=2811411 RepID=UPI0026164B05|nr:hypothetical protein [Cypionkella sp.]MDB5665375.1 hypothetical protein [Cypionkella sp.]